MKTKDIIKTNNFTKGITLISLVITIVIMLILATVSINLILGDNGLFNKTNDSAKKYSEASVKEELQTASNSIYLENKDNITNTMIADSMSQELTGLEWQDSENLVGSYKGYNFYIDENKNVIIFSKDLTVPSEIKNTNAVDISDASAFSAYRDKIKNINISIDKSPTYAVTALSDKRWDVSKENNNSILAFLETNKDDSNLYDLYIISTGKVIMPSDSSYFFNEFTNVETITGFDLLDTSNVINMDYMFSTFGYNIIQSLDLGKFDTSKATSMFNMFRNTGSKHMKSLNLGTKFNTSNVVNMSNMFYGCGGEEMTSLILGDKFNTSNVTSMNNMFGYCGYYKLSKLDLTNNFNIDKVTFMYSIFYQCGYTLMTNLNLGTSFKLPDSSKCDYSNAFNDVGKSTCTITCLSSETSKISGVCNPTRSVESL